MNSYPDDEDGQVLANLAEYGIDMTQPLEFEFAVAVPDEKSAEATLAAMTEAGYDSRIEFDEGEPDDEGEIDLDDEEFGPSWTVYANIAMVPDHAEIIRIQAELDELARPHGGGADGWGVLLDADDDEEEVEEAEEE